MRGRSFTAPFYQQIPELNKEVLHEEESFNSLFISKYLSSMRKSSMRGRSFTSLLYQQLPEFNEEVLHEGEELHLPFLSTIT